MSESDIGALKTMKVWVVHGDLCEVCVSWAAQRVWKDEMENDVSPGD